MTEPIFALYVRYLQAAFSLRPHVLSFIFRRPHCCPRLPISRTLTVPLFSMQIFSIVSNGSIVDWFTRKDSSADFSRINRKESIFHRIARRDSSIVMRRNVCIISYLLDNYTEKVSNVQLLSVVSCSRKSQHVVPLVATFQLSAKMLRTVIRGWTSNKICLIPFEIPIKILLRFIYFAIMQFVVYTWVSIIRFELRLISLDNFYSFHKVAKRKGNSESKHSNMIVQSTAFVKNNWRNLWIVFVIIQ